MAPPRYESTQVSLPRPGRGLTIVLVGLLAIWLMFAAALNWGGGSERLFLLFCGNTERILDGEIWRLFTAPLMHMPQGSIGHILMALLGLYFLSPSLEEMWGTGRFLRFLGMSALIAYGLQLVVGLVLYGSEPGKLVGSYWFGALPVVTAIAIAWALSFRGRTVRLMFVLPVSSRGLILFVVGMTLMYVIADARTPSGHIAPFGGMLAGFLLGGGTPSPLRRFYLKLRLAQLDSEAQRARTQRKQRVGQSSLRVLRGGRNDDDKGPDRDLLN
jgi:membrane associated rhomboid family serine protease